MFVNEKWMFVNEKRLCVNEKWMFVNEKRLFVNEKRLCVNEKWMFVNEKRLCVNEKRLFVNEKRLCVNEKRLYVNAKRLYDSKKCLYYPTTSDSLSTRQYNFYDQTGSMCMRVMANDMCNEVNSDKANCLPFGEHNAIIIQNQIRVNLMRRSGLNPEFYDF